VLQVVDVSKAYDGVAVLEGVSIAVEAGQIASLLGPNGAGKTTLLSIIAGLRQADGGTVSINGFDIVADRRNATMSLGLAPQDTAVQLTLTARENLLFYAELSGVARSELAARVDWAVEAMELGGFVDRKAMKLSGGERRRLHSAAAIVGRPPLLLLDEPTVGADLQTRARLLDAVRELAADGTAVVYTTHYLPEVEDLNAHVLILDDGGIIADGPLNDLLDRHASQAVELIFNGPAPLVEHPSATVVVDGDVLRATGESITQVAAHLLGSLGPDAERLRSIDVLQGSLDSVFLALTGRRFRSDTPTEVES